MGALRPSGGAEPQRRRRGEWRRLRGCGVELLAAGPGAARPRHGEGAAGLGLREEGAGGPGPRLPRRLALGGWRRPCGPRSRSVCRGRGRGGPLRPPRSPSWVAEAPGLGPCCPGARLRLSLPSGERESGPRRGDRGAGPHPLPWPWRCAPEAGSRAGRPRTRARGQGDLLRSGPQLGSPANPGQGEAGPELASGRARGGVRGRGRGPRSGCCTARTGRTEKKRDSGRI